MRILLVTQNEKMALPKAIQLLISRLSVRHEVIAGVVFDASPFGGRKTLFGKITSTIRVFGLEFFLRYGLIFVIRTLMRHDVRTVLKNAGVDILELRESINSKSSVAAISALNVDLAISVAGNQIFERNMFDVPRFGTVNLHTALLPKYRGLMPTFWALKNGEDETGVSVFTVDEGIDSGPIVVQKRIKIKNATQWQLIEMTKSLGMEAIVEAVDIIERGVSYRLANENTEASYFTFPTRSDVLQFKASGARFF